MTIRKIGNQSGAFSSLRILNAQKGTPQLRSALALILIMLTVCGIARSQQKPPAVSVDLPLRPGSTQPASMPKPAKANNEADVTIHVRGLSPLETCKLGERKSTDLVSKNALEELIKIFSGFGAFGFGPGSSGVLAEKLTIQIAAAQQRLSVVPAPLPEFSIVTEHINKASQSLAEVLKLQNEEWNRVHDASLGLGEFLKRDFRGVSQTSFETEKATISNLVEAAKKGVVDQGRIDSAQAETQEVVLLLSLVHKLHDSELTAKPSPLDPIARFDEQSILNQTALSRVLETAKALDNQIKMVVETFEQIKAILPREDLIQDLPLPKDRNVKVTESVSCISQLDKTKVTLDPVQVSVTYQNVSRLTMSIGMLLSSLEKQEIGTSPVKTGIDANGVPTFKTTFAITDQAKGQAIPFAFLNVKLHDWQWKSRTYTFNLSGGAGVNPNSGTKEPEFFSGVALGLDRMLIHLGAHTGRLQRMGGGFLIGETVPDKFPSTLPIVRKYENRFAIGLSFRMMP